MFTTLASRFFGKTETAQASRPRRASAIRKQQVLRQSSSYYGDVYSDLDVYEEQNPWVEIVDEAEDFSDMHFEVEVKAVKPAKKEELQPSVSQLLKKLAVSATRPLESDSEIRSHSSLFPPPPLAGVDRGYAVSGNSYRSGVDFGVGLPPAA